MHKLQFCILFLYCFAVKKSKAPAIVVQREDDELPSTVSSGMLYLLFMPSISFGDIIFMIKIEIFVSVLSVIHSKYYFWILKCLYFLYAGIVEYASFSSVSQEQNVEDPGLRLPRTL